jgi:hypothetical protein
MTLPAVFSPLFTVPSFRVFRSLACGFPAQSGKWEVCGMLTGAGPLVPAGEAVEALIDDTLFRRRGKKVWAASWFHDRSAQGPVETGFGNN